MPIWTIEGADRNTGKDVIVSIDAPTEELARQEATEKGILVSEVHQSIADEPRRPGHTSQAMPPEYQDILRGNQLLSFFGSLLAALGWVGLLIAAAGLAYAIYWRIKGDMEAFVGLEAFIGGLTYAVPCFVGAVILRMYGALAIAVRDIARNSF
ncbi:MAG TPA: hypothetical protein VGG19_20710 [Tepidisphaeraceae bacterium]|jgi:hypothetical protein